VHRAAQSILGQGEYNLTPFPTSFFRDDNMTMILHCNCTSSNYRMLPPCNTSNPSQTPMYAHATPHLGSDSSKKSCSRSPRGRRCCFLLRRTRLWSGLLSNHPRRSASPIMADTSS
jgi:hypothetical protein